MSPPASPLQLSVVDVAGPEEHDKPAITKTTTTATTTTVAQDASIDDVAPAPLRPALSRSRTMTTTAEIDSTITKPGSVKINVTGAFIVDPDTATPKNGRGSPTTHHETSDIRLPNHTAVVSHIAVDVCLHVLFAPLCNCLLITRWGVHDPLFPDWRLPHQTRILFPRGRPN